MAGDAIRREAVRRQNRSQPMAAATARTDTRAPPLLYTLYSCRPEPEINGDVSIREQ